MYKVILIVNKMCNQMYMNKIKKEKTDKVWRTWSILLTRKTFKKIKLNEIACKSYL